VSQGLYASLNFAWSTGDDEALVRENLRRAAGALGVPAEQLYFLSQVHGVEVRRLAGGEPWEEVIRWTGDAVASARPGLACGVRVADCVPVLVGDARSGAACAIHAGWRGAVGGVVLRALDELKALGVGGGELVAAVGPHISKKSFEIGPEVAAQLDAAAPGHQVTARGENGSLYGDLRTLVEVQLRAAGVGQVDHVEGCTLLDAARFYSFRRDGARSGRHLAAVVPRGAR